MCSRYLKINGYEIQYNLVFALNIGKSAQHVIPNNQFFIAFGTTYSTLNFTISVDFCKMSASVLMYKYVYMKMHRCYEQLFVLFIGFKDYKK